MQMSASLVPRSRKSTVFAAILWVSLALAVHFYRDSSSERAQSPKSVRFTGVATCGIRGSCGELRSLQKVALSRVATRLKGVRVLTQPALTGILST